MVFTYNVARFFIEVESFEDGAKEIDVSLKVFDDHTPEGQLVAKISLDELLAQSGPRRYFTAQDWTPVVGSADTYRRNKMETLRDRYNIYVACLEGSNTYIKTFDEWLNS